ncbi:PREDICTED: probable N-acetyltransferase 8B-like [Elephantulus edwardii]|uniref:probable N-acetyltransferase 8B-like n=1 Tax=Elephantulus edwardii TaxID=28737 RepID=UPI0003F09393|nr:PREDICTED: probable N-acetyltransferase 8B-like [Elephantulus edwardii]
MERTDMADITKTYFSEPGSYFWVAESGEKVLGMVGCLPTKNPGLRGKQVELLHMFVALEHQGQGVAKTLIRTLFQFARDQGYSEVILSTSVLQRPALGLYQRLGFRRMHEFWFSTIWRILDIPSIYFIYHLPSA